LMEEERERAREELLQPAPSQDTDTDMQDNAGDGGAFADAEEGPFEETDE